MAEEKCKWHIVNVHYGVLKFGPYRFSRKDRETIRDAFARAFPYSHVGRIEITQPE